MTTWLVFGDVIQAAEACAAVGQFTCEGKYLRERALCVLHSEHGPVLEAPHIAISEDAALYTIGVVFARKINRPRVTP